MTRQESGPAAATVPDTEARIFDAALHVFARKGKDGARMQEIADEAGIHRPLLHYYFRTKQQLYEAVARRMFSQFMDTFDAPRGEGGFVETLRAFIDHYVDSVHANQSMASWIVAENLAGNPLLGEMLAEAFATEGSPQREMEQAIERSIRAGEIRPVDPKQLMLTIVSGCVFFFVALPTVKMMNPLARENLEAFIEQRKAHLFDVLYHGLAAREVSRV
ncbi:MAG: TetR/AcrR family transcriptional regulator [Gemmatimonadota bacterium]